MSEVKPLVVGAEVIVDAGILGDVHYYVPNGFYDRPKSVLQVLRQARAVLVEDGRWAREFDFRSAGYCKADGEQPKSPFCGDWRACARGVVQILTFGASKVSDTNRWKRRTSALRDGDRTLYDAAMLALKKASQDVAGVASGAYDIVSFNDAYDTRLDDVLKAFDLAIEREEQRESEERANHKGTVIDGVQFYRYVPAGFEGEPTDVVDVLKRARAILVEEDRWATGAWFRNNHPDVNPQDPFCNSWKVCAEGAVGIAALGVRTAKGVGCQCSGCQKIEKGRLWAHDLTVWSKSRFYDDAKRHLVEAGKQLHPRRYNDVASFNDHVFDTRTEVIAWFDLAIELAEGDA